MTAETAIRAATFANGGFSFANDSSDGTIAATVSDDTTSVYNGEW